MKVSELITHLLTCDPEAEVVANDPDEEDGIYCPVAPVLDGAILWERETGNVFYKDDPPEDYEDCTVEPATVLGICFRE